MTQPPFELREAVLREMLKSLAPSGGEPDHAAHRYTDAPIDTRYPVYDDAERASLALVATAMIEHQTRMAMLGRGMVDARATIEPAPAGRDAAARTAIDLWVMVFSDEDCTEYTGEALHRRTLVDAVPRAGEYLVPGQLNRFSTLRPVVERVEHAPFPENEDTPTVLVVIHVAAVAESEQGRQDRRGELRAEGWSIALPQPHAALESEVSS
jgi:hypothetical protein